MYHCKDTLVIHISCACMSFAGWRVTEKLVGKRRQLYMNLCHEKAGNATKQINNEMFVELIHRRPKVHTSFQIIKCLDIPHTKMQTCSTKTFPNLIQS